MYKGALNQEFTEHVEMTGPPCARLYSVPLCLPVQRPPVLACTAPTGAYQYSTHRWPYWTPPRTPRSLLRVWRSCPYLHSWSKDSWSKDS